MSHNSICGPEDVVIEIKAAAICGADMKHYNVGSVLMSLTLSAAMSSQAIAQVGEKSKTGVGQRVVSDNSGHVCGACPACNKVIFCVVQKK